MMGRKVHDTIGRHHQRIVDQSYTGPRMSRSRWRAWTLASKSQHNLPRWGSPQTVVSEMLSRSHSVQSRGQHKWSAMYHYLSNQSGVGSFGQPSDMVHERGLSYMGFPSQWQLGPDHRQMGAVMFQELKLGWHKCLIAVVHSMEWLTMLVLRNGTRLAPVGLSSPCWITDRIRGLLDGLQ